MMKTTTSWPQDTWNVIICSFGWEIYKNVKYQKTIFFRRAAVMKSFIFFLLSGKLSIMMKTTTSWPQDTWNMNICSFGWEICKNENCQKKKKKKKKKKSFFGRSSVRKSSIFSTFWKKPCKMMKTTTNWPQDSWNVNICSFGCEICINVKCLKMTFFSQGRGHENLQIFDFRECLVKCWNPSPVDQRTLEMLNSLIYSVGEFIAVEKVLLF